MTLKVTTGPDLTRIPQRKLEMNIKLLSVLAVSVALLGCASKPSQQYAVVQQPAQQYAPEPPAPVYKLRNYQGPEAMDSDEVLAASRQCILIKMRPHVTHVSVRTEAGKLRVPVSVNCEPF